MVDVWYIKYGDEFGNINPATIYNEVLAAIKAEDPDAYIKEVRQYPYQIAFLVAHPTTTTATIGEKRLIFGIIILVALAIAAVLGAAGYAINAWTNYCRNTQTYTDTDPATGEQVEIKGYDAYRAWLIGHYPNAAKYLSDMGADDWWTSIIKPIIWIVVAIIGVAGFAMVLPMLTKGITKARREAKAGREV